MSAERLVLVGGDAAGMSAASQARRLRGPDALQIVAFERSPHTSYSACGTPYYAGGLVERAEQLVVRSPEVFRNDFSIDARVLHEVESIDLANGRVKGTDLESSTPFEEPFDELLVATGTEPIRPRIDGIESNGVFGMSTLQSAIEVRAALDQWKPRRAVVVGGGYIGLEMAEALLERGVETSLVEALEQPMTTLDPDFGTIVADALRAAGVKTFLGEAVVGFESDGGRVSGVVTDTRTLPADIVILGLGTRPNVSLAAEAGLELGESGAIKVDDRMRTTREGVWSAGDCAEQFHRVSRRPVNFHLGTIANKMGRIAGLNIGGREATFPGVLGTAITKICDLEVSRTGLSATEARSEGFDFVETVVSSRTKSGYFPGSSRLHIKVIADKASRKLLGAQIAGGEGSAKRIDVFAACLWSSMTVDDMVNMDLSYAPPFATTWDAVLIAARGSSEALG